MHCHGLRAQRCRECNLQLCNVVSVGFAFLEHRFEGFPRSHVSRVLQSSGCIISPSWGLRKLGRCTMCCIWGRCICKWVDCAVNKTEHVHVRTAARAHAIKKHQAHSCTLCRWCQWQPFVHVRVNIFLRIHAQNMHIGHTGHTSVVSRAIGG